MTRTARHAHLRHLAVLCLIATLSGGASCVSDGGGDSDRGNPGTYGNNGGYGRDNDYNSNSSDRPNRIPRFADVVKEDGGKLRWRADLDGTIYLYDKSADAIRYTGPVRRGDEVMVQPNDDRVSINDRTVGTENLHRDAFHQLYFAAARNGGYGGNSGYGGYNNGGYGGGGYGDGGYGRDDRRDPDRRPAQKNADSVTGLPADAERLARGRDGVDFKSAPRGGTVYLYNESTRELLTQFTVRRGQSVTVSPAKNMVYVDGEQQQRVKIAKGSMLSLHLAGR